MAVISVSTFGPTLLVLLEWYILNTLSSIMAQLEAGVPIKRNPGGMLSPAWRSSAPTSEKDVLENPLSPNGLGRSTSRQIKKASKLLGMLQDEHQHRNSFHRDSLH